MRHLRLRGRPPDRRNAAAIINVAESTDLMTNPEAGARKCGAIIDVRPIKHIWLVGNNRAPVQGTARGNDLTMLTADELERYARHIVLREVGGPGQTALKEASVLVIGAGGLGAPVLMYLAAAGVGTLGAVDDDIVSLSNLQRQIIHTTPDIGRRKVDSAAEQIHALNPHVDFEAHAVRLDAQQCDVADRRLRSRARRLRQFRNPLSGVGRLLPCRQSR